MTTNSFRDSVLERLATLDSLYCKHMFRGYGSYSGGVFFGIMFDGRMYFKTHPGTLQDYLNRHTAVFAPSEKQISRNYHKVHVDILEDSERLAHWTREAAQP